jgi:hypothetical protein
VTLYKVDVTNNQGTLLSLELANISNGILLADIDGLGPVKATLVSSSFARLDGEQFHAARREARNIIFKIKLRPDFVSTTARDLRSQLYNFFMPKSPVDLKFYMDDGLTVNISGYVETCEPNIFTQEPAVDVSIMCFQPDFVDVTTQTISEDTVSDTTELDVEYDGTVETGIVFTLNLNRTESDFTIYHRAPDGALRQLDFSESLLSGDVLVINTNPGTKSATLTRTGTSTSILNGVSPQSNWISLSKGTNTIRVYATGAAIPYTITYMNKYGGL